MWGAADHGADRQMTVKFTQMITLYTYCDCCALYRSEPEWGICESYNG
jgi:hypothetical protein